MKRSIVPTLVLIAAGLGIVGGVAAQSGTRRTIPPSSGRMQGSDTRGLPQSARQVERPFSERFWDYLSKAQYRNWAPLPGQTADAYEGNSPHGAQVKLYANRLAAGEASEFPFGSILVKENFDETGTKLMAVTVMYRSKGFAAESNDWCWAKFEPNGTVSRMEDRSIAGRVQMCIDCHSTAGGDDYVFANDK